MSAVWIKAQKSCEINMNLEKIKHDLRKQMIKHDRGLVTDQNLFLVMLRVVPTIRHKLTETATENGLNYKQCYDLLDGTYFWKEKTHDEIRNQHDNPDSKADGKYRGNSPHSQ